MVPKCRNECLAPARQDTNRYAMWVPLVQVRAVACGNRHTVFVSRSEEVSEGDPGVDAMTMDLAHMRRASMLAEEAALVPGPFDGRVHDRLTSGQEAGRAMSPGGGTVGCCMCLCLCLCAI